MTTAHSHFPLWFFRFRRRCAACRLPMILDPGKDERDKWKSHCHSWHRLFQLPDHNSRWLTWLSLQFDFFHWEDLVMNCTSFAILLCRCRSPQTKQRSKQWFVHWPCQPATSSAHTLKCVCRIASTGTPFFLKDCTHSHQIRVVWEKPKIRQSSRDQGDSWKDRLLLWWKFLFHMGAVSLFESTLFDLWNPWTFGTAVGKKTIYNFAIGIEFIIYSWRRNCPINSWDEIGEMCACDQCERWFAANTATWDHSRSTRNSYMQIQSSWTEAHSVGFGRGRNQDFNRTWCQNSATTSHRKRCKILGVRNLLSLTSNFSDTPFAMTTASLSKTTTAWQWRWLEEDLCFSLPTLMAEKTQYPKKPHAEMAFHNSARNPAKDYFVNTRGPRVRNPADSISQPTQTIPTVSSRKLSSNASIWPRKPGVLESPMVGRGPRERFWDGWWLGGAMMVCNFVGRLKEIGGVAWTWKRSESGSNLFQKSTFWESLKACKQWSMSCDKTGAASLMYFCCVLATEDAASLQSVEGSIELLGF